MKKRWEAGWEQEDPLGNLCDIVERSHDGGSEQRGVGGSRRSIKNLDLSPGLLNHWMQGARERQKLKTSPGVLVEQEEDGGTIGLAGESRGWRQLWVGGD